MQCLTSADCSGGADVACNTNTIKHPAPPSKEALLDNQAQLLKDVLAALSWNCVQLLAKEPFAIPAENPPNRPRPWQTH